MLHIQKRVSFTSNYVKTTVKSIKRYWKRKSSCSCIDQVSNTANAAYCCILAAYWCIFKKIWILVQVVLKITLKLVKRDWYKLIASYVCIRCLILPLLHIAVYLQYTWILTKVSWYELNTSFDVYCKKGAHWEQDGCKMLLRKHPAGRLQHTLKYSLANYRCNTISNLIHLSCNHICILKEKFLHLNRYQYHLFLTTIYTIRIQNTLT